MRALLLSILCAASVAAVTPDRTAAPEPTSGCTFAIAPPISAAVVAGDNDAARRASVMAQPDSPLRILGVDLSGLVLDAGYGSFTRHGRHVMDVQNVSDEVISEARCLPRPDSARQTISGAAVRLDRSSCSIAASASPHDAAIFSEITSSARVHPRLIAATGFDAVTAAFTKR